MKASGYKKIIGYSAVVIAICVASECVATQFRTYDLFLPRPVTLLRFFLNNPAQFFIASIYTCTKILAGLVLGLIVATALSLAGVWFPSIRPVLTRVTLWSQTMPVPLLSPLLGLAFGYNLWSASIVTALICFFPVYLGWEQGRMALPLDVSLLAASYRPSRITYTRHILLPAGFPYALLGVKGAINLAVLGAVIAEFGAASQGLGRLMVRGIRELSPAQSWGAMLILVGIAATMAVIVGRIQRSDRFSYIGGPHDFSSNT
ncbi:MAG: ABC transporter permease subunit [Planctomycetota bacterium]|nr:ABC transporter permease subunit [Planctomycetota bacterium]